MAGRIDNVGVWLVVAAMATLATCDHHNDAEHNSAASLDGGDLAESMKSYEKRLEEVETRQAMTERNVLDNRQTSVDQQIALLNHRRMIQENNDEKIERNGKFNPEIEKSFINPFNDNNELNQKENYKSYEDNNKQLYQILKYDDYTNDDFRNKDYRVNVNNLNVVNIENFNDFRNTDEKDNDYNWQNREDSNDLESPTSFSFYSQSRPQSFLDILNNQKQISMTLDYNQRSESPSARDFLSTLPSFSPDYNSYQNSQRMMPFSSQYRMLVPMSSSFQQQPSIIKVYSDNQRKMTNRNPDFQTLSSSRNDQNENRMYKSKTQLPFGYSERMNYLHSLFGQKFFDTQKKMGQEKDTYVSQRQNNRDYHNVNEGSDSFSMFLRMHHIDLNKMDKNDALKLADSFYKRKQANREIALYMPKVNDFNYNKNGGYQSRNYRNNGYERNSYFNKQNDYSGKKNYEYGSYESEDMDEDYLQYEDKMPRNSDILDGFLVDNKDVVKAFNNMSEAEKAKYANEDESIEESNDQDDKAYSEAGDESSSEEKYEH